LRNRGIDTLVVCGAVTEFCIDTTVRRAASLGYRVVVGADSHTTKSQPDMSAAAIIAHHNRVWSEFSAPQPVSVVPSDSIQFG
jgi:nicotinamidase-related amidase